MTNRSPDFWSDLLARLEADIAAAHAGSRDEVAWVLVRREVEAYARHIFAHNSTLRWYLDDIVQAVILKLQSRNVLRLLRARTSPVAYLIVMIRNTGIDLVREHGKEVRLVESLGPRSRTFAAHSPIGSIEQSAIVRKALRILSVDERELIYLRFWGNLSIGDIAARRGAKYSATAVRLFRALRKLRRHLERT
jgi:RNA polymerase sigma factor (sigma-70 family)